jgi:hypothetical protein
MCKFVHRFSVHVAYTMAKYGMSMCVLGMSEEFKPFNIGVNALWPKTGEFNFYSVFISCSLIILKCSKKETVEILCRKVIMSFVRSPLLSQDRKNNKLLFHLITVQYYFKLPFISTQFDLISYRDCCH